MKKNEYDLIEKTIVWERGVTAETAILLAFKCNVEFIQCIDDLISYTRSPQEFLEENDIDQKLISKFSASKESSKFYKDHNIIAENKSLIRSLLRKLFSDIYEQTENNLNKGLSIVNTEQLNFIHVPGYKEHRERLDDEKVGLSDEILPPVVLLDLEEYTISYESLHRWFKKYAVKVDKWSSVETFCKQSLGEIKLPARTRSKENSKDSDFYVYSALLQECAIQLQTNTRLPKGFSKTNFINNNGKLIRSNIANYLCSRYEGLNENRSVDDSLKALSEFEVSRKTDENKTG